MKIDYSMYTLFLWHTLQICDLKKNLGFDKKDLHR